jgi:hypothetical protein
VNWLDANFLFASLFWGSVGVGYWIYGRRQTLWSPMIGGVAMIAIAYFVSSALLMSLFCLGAAVAVYFLARRGV